MSKWIICVLVSSITGTILYGVWYLFCGCADKRKYLASIYGTLHVVTVFFALLAFAGIAVSVYLTTIPLYSFWAYTNAKVEYPAMVLGGIWAAGEIYRLGKYVYWHILHKKMVRTLEPVNAEIHRIGAQVGIALGIKRPVELLSGSVLFTAELAGWKKPVVLLPAYEYTEDQVENIVTHELMHYRNRDRVVRELAIVLHCVHWFNPIVKHLHRSLERWDELYCDRCVCEQKYIGNKEYAGTLMYMSEKMVEKREAFMAIAFSERGTNMIERMGEVLAYRRGSMRRRITTVGLVMLFILCSAGTSLAAGMGTYHAYDHLIKNVMEGVEEEIQEPVQLQEYEMYLGEVAVEQMVDAELMAEPSGSFSETIANRSWISGGFQASVGQSISVSVYGDPATVYLKVGIIEPDGRMRYVYHCGDISHTFRLDKTGTQ